MCMWCFGRRRRRERRSSQQQQQPHAQTPRPSSPLTPSNEERTSIQDDIRLDRHPASLLPASRPPQLGGGVSSSSPAADGGSASAEQETNDDLAALNGSSTNGRSSSLPLSIRARLALAEANSSRRASSDSASSSGSSSILGSLATPRSPPHLPLFNLPEEPPPELDLADAQEAPPLPLPPLGPSTSLRRPKKRVRFAQEAEVGGSGGGGGGWFGFLGRSRASSSEDDHEAGGSHDEMELRPLPLSNSAEHLPPSHSALLRHTTNLVPNPSPDGFVWISRPRNTLRLAPLLPLQIEPFKLETDRTWDLVQARVNARERRAQRAQALREERERTGSTPSSTSALEGRGGVGWSASQPAVPFPSPAVLPPQAGPSRVRNPPQVTSSDQVSVARTPLSAFGVPFPTNTRPSYNTPPPPPQVRNWSAPTSWDTPTAISTRPSQDLESRASDIPYPQRRRERETTADTALSEGVWSDADVRAHSRLYDTPLTAASSPSWETPGTSPILGDKWSDAVSSKQSTPAGILDEALLRRRARSGSEADSAFSNASSSGASDPFAPSSASKGKGRETDPSASSPPLAGANRPDWLFPLPSWTSTGQLSAINEVSEADPIEADYYVEEGDPVSSSSRPQSQFVTPEWSGTPTPPASVHQRADSILRKLPPSPPPPPLPSTTAPPSTKEQQTLMAALLASRAEQVREQEELRAVTPEPRLDSDDSDEDAWVDETPAKQQRRTTLARPVQSTPGSTALERVAQLGVQKRDEVPPGSRFEERFEVDSSSPVGTPLTRSQVDLLEEELGGTAIGVAE